MAKTEVQYSKSHYFYVLYCKDKTLYGGYTTEPLRRLTAHNRGVGAKYTRASHRRPLQMVYIEEWPDKQSAMQAEYRFKQLTRPQKEKYLKQHGVQRLDGDNPTYFDARDQSQ